MLVSLLIKLQGFSPATLLKETPTQVFSCEYLKIFKNTFLQSTSGRLLLKVESENISGWWLTYSLYKEEVDVEQDFDVQSG